jgi:hypothetical protein
MSLISIYIITFKNIDKLADTRNSDIIEISFNISYLLDDYVKIHNKCFNTSIRHIVPIPGIFKSIDFGLHIKDLKNIILELLQYNDRINDIKNSDKNGSDIEKEYISFLNDYLDALLNTVSYFKYLLKPLYERSQNINNEDYSMKTYKKNLAQYYDLINIYSKMGMELGEKYNKFKEEIIMSNPIFYKRIKERDIYIKVIYDYRVNLCGNKCLPSQLKITLSGLSDDFKEEGKLGYKDFCIDEYDWAEKNDIDSEEANEELEIAENYFNNNSDIAYLKNNSTIASLMSEVDNFLEKI